jgi:hypothetical protein
MNKIVDTDNYGGDYPDEKFLSWTDSNNKTRIAKFSPSEAEEICKILNSGPEGSRFFKPVPDNYKLSPGFEP